MISFCGWVKNIEGTGKNAAYQHFLLFAKYFQRRPLPWSLTLNKPWFLCVCSTSLLKTLWEKGEIACNEQFLLFPQCFLLFGELSVIFMKFEIVVCKLNSLEVYKICHVGKG